MFKGWLVGSQPEEEEKKQGIASAMTNSSSSQSEARLQNQQFDGWTSQEALEKFGDRLTEFEKIEIGIHDRIYTIGTVRRQNQYKLANHEGYYMLEKGEQLGYRYETVKVIDQGAFG